MRLNLKAIITWVRRTTDETTWVSRGLEGVRRRWKGFNPLEVKIPSIPLEQGLAKQSAKVLFGRWLNYNIVVWDLKKLHHDKCMLLPWFTNYVEKHYVNAFKFSHRC